ncbi:ABC transporter permease [Paenibacillus sp. UMB4589-SE434]|uniref:ABC transporter permease n=1 Tax=Paenibacillus sp. UMB4589-SE434 TaxID=3046314 RepID=UPI00254EDF73|nr:ABC transporter permease [Paenibacillus sp. UMB4589-SE434]MDK8183997.1 ABC transporter permease [Paenibacillus sp. UMB4589-SE434]
MARVEASRQSSPGSNIKRLLTPENLWAKRVSTFWGEIAPYLRYVVQSGLGMVLVFGIVAGIALYASFIEHIPPQFPVRELAWVLMSPLVAYMTLRTFLVPADLVFLLRQEHKLGTYLRKSLRYSLFPRMLFLMMGWAVLWPLYHRADPEPKSFVVMLLVLMVLKLVALYGSWVERHISDVRWRFIMRTARYIWAWGATACWLWLDVSLAGIVTGAAGIMYVFCARRIPALRFPWEAHMEAERVHVNRVYTFLSGFVDLPTMNERRFARPWLDWLGNRFAFRRDQAYRYLLTKTFLRSELLGIILRLIAIGLLLLWWTRNTMWNGLLILLFLTAISAQCNALYQMHRHDVWRQLYPLEKDARTKAVLHLSTEIQTIAALLLLVPVWTGMTSTGYRLSVSVLSAVFIFLFRLQNKAKHRKQADDED